jgi:hypothetical protein
VAAQAAIRVQAMSLLSKRAIMPILLSQRQHLLLQEAVPAANIAVAEGSHTYCLPCRLTQPPSSQQSGSGCALALPSRPLPHS